MSGLLHAEPAEPGALVPRDRELSLGQKVVRAGLLVLALGGALAAAWLLRFLVLPVVLGLLATYFLGPLVNLLEDRGLARSHAVALCYGSLVLALVGVGFALWPTIDAWLQEAPAKTNERSVFEVQLEHRLGAWEAQARAAYPNVDWGQHFGHAHAVLEAQRVRLMETLPAMASGALSNAGTFVLGLVLAFFLLLQGAEMQRAVVSLVPNRYFETVLTLLHRVDGQISGYLRGVAAEAALVSLVTVLALWAVGMPNALLLGCLFGALHVVPVVGPLIGGAAGLLFALVEPSAPSIGVLLALYTVVHVLDVALINPLVMGKSLDMHPLTLILAITAGGGLGGVLGMLISVPVVAVAKAVVTTLWEAHRAGKLRHVG